jgi:hypothetical protein
MSDIPSSPATGKNDMKSPGKGIGYYTAHLHIEKIMIVDVDRRITFE